MRAKDQIGIKPPRRKSKRRWRKRRKGKSRRKRRNGRSRRKRRRVKFWKLRSNANQYPKHQHLQVKPFRRTTTTLSKLIRSMNKMNERVLGNYHRCSYQTNCPKKRPARRQSIHLGSCHLLTLCLSPFLRSTTCRKLASLKSSRNRARLKKRNISCWLRPEAVLRMTRW